MRIGPASLMSEPFKTLSESIRTSSEAFGLPHVLLLCTLAFIILLPGCSRCGLIPRTQRGTGLRLHADELNISLNVGLLNAGSLVFDRKDIESHLRSVEREFAAANPGDSLSLILDQPQSATFIMERASRRYRGPVIGPSFIAETKNDSSHERILAQLRKNVRERTDYTVVFRDDGSFFLRSGLALYAGGQVHYDIVFLSERILSDFDDPNSCHGSDASAAPDAARFLDRHSGMGPDVFRSPGRSALDGLSVFVFAGDPENLRRALSVLLSPRSPCVAPCDGQCLHIPPGRRAMLIRLAEKNGEVGPSQVEGACVDERGLLPVQREMLHNSGIPAVRDCRQR